MTLLCPQEVTNGLRSSPTRMGSTWKSRWSLLCQHSLAVTKHMFILCLQPGQSRTGEVRACTESEDSLRPPSPNERFVGDDQDQPYWRMLWKSDISAFCLKALCQQSVLCMGNRLHGSFLHLWVIKVNNLSALPGLEAEVVGMSFDIHFSVQMASQQPHT